MKEILGYIIAVILLLSCVSCASSNEERDVATAEVVLEFSDKNFCGVVFSDGRAEVQKYLGGDGYVDIPDEIDGIEINSIGSGFGESQMHRITIPAGVLHVEPGAFANCWELVEFRVNAQNPVLSEINGVLFSKTDKALICYPSGCEETYYEIPEGIKSIAGGAFCRCPFLQVIAIPRSVESIDPIVIDEDGIQLCLENPFLMCAELKSFQVDEGNRKLKVIDNALYSYDGKRLISCPPASIPYGVGSQYAVAEGTEVIGAAAFCSCANLSEVYLPKTLKTIEGFAFAECILLNGIEVPNSVTEIGMGAFLSCDGMTKAVLPEKLSVIEYSLFAGCTSLKDVTIPENITQIEERAFEYCKSLKELKLPKDVEDIGYNAFDEKYLTLNVAEGSRAEALAKAYSIPYKTY